MLKLQYHSYQSTPPSTCTVDKSKQPPRYVTTSAPRKYFNENPYFRVAIRTPARPTPPSGAKKSPAPPAKPKLFHLTFPRAPGGPFSGCFHGFPRYMSDPYEPEKPKARKKKGKKELPPPPLWQPVVVPVTRTKYTESVVDKVTNVACNAVTYADYREQVYPLSWGGMTFCGSEMHWEPLHWKWSVLKGNLASFES